ncbi:hypothetical protein LIX17_23900 [Mycobacterium avium subsp. hominissuis]|nr:MULTISPECIES: hypothetical protein [Mycobacteriaceae]ETZ57981.1 putative lipoprotein [Mycobacterium avium MAV_120709_2344]MCA2335101.1 hypothetical protein [Mycobacterium avium]SIN05220.1 Uncharacterised protein [Mycobacteroides abscessus subsp. abscessus]SLE72372.1 Uncharacterised protein [Mycobacteroides abscessus subsp. abscessus]
MTAKRNQLQSFRRRPGMRVSLAALLTACALAACSPVNEPRTEPAQPDISPIEAIQTLGQMGLPVWPEILDAESDAGADTRYRLTMRLDDGQLEEFLSQFPIAPQPSEIPRTMSVIAGPALQSAPDPLFLQNGIGSQDGAYVREIIVDKRAPDETYVHIAVYSM